MNQLVHGHAHEVVLIAWSNRIRSPIERLSQVHVHVDVVVTGLYIRLQVVAGQRLGILSAGLIARIGRGEPTVEESGISGCQGISSGVAIRPNAHRDGLVTKAGANKLSNDAAGR